MRKIPVLTRVGKRLPKLYLAHNLPAELLVRGIERGAELPAPSLAFKTAGLPHTGFGGGEFGAPVTLFGRKKLAEETGAFTADIWTKMYPRDQLENLEVPTVSGRRAADIFREEPELQRTFASVPQNLRTEIEDAVDTFINADPGTKLDAGNAIFRRIGDAVENVRRTNPEEYANLRTRYKPSGDMPEVAEIAESMYDDVSRIIARPATGAEQSQAALRYLRTRGNPRMSGSGFEGPGLPTALRAWGAEYLPTLADIRAEASTGIRSPQTRATEMTRRTNRFERAVIDLRRSLKRFSGIVDDEAGEYLNDVVGERNVAQAIARAAKEASDAEWSGLRSSPVMTLDDLRKAFASSSGELPENARWPAALESQLRKLHKSYATLVTTPDIFFEAKPQRMVKLNEFARAMVPETVSPEIKKQIAAVLPVTEYSASARQSVFSPTKDVEREWMKGFSEARRAGLRHGAPIAFGINGVAATQGLDVPDDAETQKAGVEFGWNLPTVIALGLGGAAARRVLGRVGTARAALAAEKAAKQIDLTEIARQSSEMVRAQQAATRSATRMARAAERIAEPVGPRPVDAWNSPKTPTDVFEFAARIASDPEGARAIAEATEQAVQGGLVRGGRITWETERTIAKSLGVDAQDLALRDPSRTVSGPEFLALTEAYGAESQRKVLLRQVIDNPLSTVEEKRLAEQLYDVVDNRATTIFQRLVRDRGETGRMLNLMKAAKAQSTNPADWLYKAQKLAGGRPLSPEMAAEIIRAIERGEFVKAKMVLNRAKASNAGVLDKVGEFFQTSLLSRIGRPFRDLISNSVNSLDRRAQYAVASALDRVMNGLGVYPTRVMAGTPAQVNAAGKRGARIGWQQAFELIRARAGKEMTAESLDALERAARRYDFSDESSFTNPFLRAWGTFVRRTIAASDQPFYESAFAMAMETQARAVGVNMKLSGRALDEFVESTLANPPSEMVRTAIEEGAEAVFQQQTTIGKAAAALGGRGSKNPIARFAGKQFIPFAQTPSAITTQALEQTPLGLINVAPEAVLAAAGSTAAQRKTVMGLAKVSTGAAWIYTGYLLADEGKINLFYPDDPNERARWQEENRIANSILVNGKWVALTGLLGPQAMLMSIGGLVRQYTEEDAKGLAAALTQASAVGAAEGLVETPAMQGVSSVMDILKAARQDDPARMEEALGRSLESQVTGYIPGVVQQVAAMGDVDEEGRVIMRDPMAGETFSEDIMNALKMGIPGQREELPAKVSPFGRIRSSGPGGLESLVTPLRTTVSQATPLTETMEDIGYFPAPSPRRKKEGEVVEQYNLRRMAEGPQEKAFLEALLAGDESAWQFVSRQAQEEYVTTQDAAELVKSALRSYRSARTREQRKPK